ncbi:MAG: hypothetical protein J6K32_02320 [Clostridia bacterium]|nr:hypothetical protein [Clostridia bacterium]
MATGKTRRAAAAWLGGMMYALFAAFGWQAQHLGRCAPLPALAAAAVMTPLFAGLLAFLWGGGPGRAVERLGLRRSAKGQGDTPFHTGRAFAAILACYVPMFLAAYPGSFAYDVPFQLRQVFTGAYSTHHPLLHTLLLGGCVRLGQALGSINLGAALYTVIQMTALAGCFALACASIGRRCGGRRARQCAVFFALYPLHMFMSVNATKDVLFAGLFALTLALTTELIETGGGRRLHAAAALAGCGMLLLRNNALYALAVWLVIMAIPLLRGRRGVLACMAAALMMSSLVGHALQGATKAADGDMSEMLSWPIQQLARARLQEEEKLTPEEITAIDELMPGEAWRLYDPTVSDPVKFEFDTARFLSDPGKYARVYLSVGGKCLKTYADALLVHTYSFFYPYSEYGVSGYYLQMGVSGEQTEQWCDFPWISQTSPLRRVVDSLSWRFGAKGAMQIPVVGWLFNMGVIVWVMLYLWLREMYRGCWLRFGAGLLPVLLWGTFLLGPVMAGRYIYPFVCCLPVLWADRPRTE